MRYIVRHRNHGYDAVPAQTTAALAVEGTVALAAAGRGVTVADEVEKPVDVEDLAEQVRCAAGG